MGRNYKVVVIGLDGATWDLIRPWSEKGLLPTFKFLMDNGTWGILESTIPPLSPSAWTSIYTGCMPSKHKIFGFIKRKKETYFYTPISSRDRKKPAIWEVLSKHGKRSIVINALFSYPPKDINGIIITGLGTPSKKSDFVRPKDYKAFILDNFPRYDVDFNEGLLLVSRDVNNFIKKIKEITDEQIRLTKYFIENEQWDFLFSIFRAFDVIQHYFWDRKNLLLYFYKMFDLFFRWLTQNRELYTHLFIVSDHGFSPVKKYFCVNEWLQSIGLLKMKRKEKKSIITAESITEFILKLGMKDIVWRLKRTKAIEKILKIVPSEDFGYLSEIDWSNTKAYFYEGSDGIICINLKGREPRGIVSEEEYPKLVKYVVNGLKNVKDPETGKKIVKQVFTKEELFNTSDKSLPDIFILLEDEYRAVSHNKISNSLFMPPLHGRTLRPADHHINGIFLAFGNGIAHKMLVNKVKTWDIAPTVFHILGVPIPREVDGRVLKEIFREDSELAKRSVDTILQTYMKKKLREKIKRLKTCKAI